jgi:hypothetical protein
VKSGAIDKLSIGYSVVRERRAQDGATELLAINLKEVSLVMNPANERARVLAIKSEADVPSHAELEAELVRQGLIGHDERYKSIRDHERRRMLTLLNDESDKAIEPSAKSQQPMRIASFEC